jgi:hypothetical protein
LSTSPRHLQAKTTHPSPSAREFRLLLNGLARNGRARSRKRVHVLPPVQVPRPEGRPAGPCRALTALPVSRVSTRAKIKSPKDQKTKACVPEGMRSLNDVRQGSLPTALLHLESGANGFWQLGCDRSTMLARARFQVGGQHSPERVKRWHAQPTPGAYAAAVTSAISGIRRQHRWTGATVSGRDRSTILARARFQPCEPSQC